MSGGGALPAGPVALDESLRQRVEAALVARAFELSPRNLAASFVASSLAAVLFRDERRSSAVLFWWLALTLVTLVRYGMIRRYRARRPEVAEAHAWARRATLGAFAAGALWGFGIVALAPPWGSAPYILAVFLVSGVPAAAIWSNAAILPSFLSFVLPIFVPYGLHLLSSGDLERVFGGLAALTYAAVFTGIGRAVNRHLAESFTLRFQNVDLVERLSAGNEILRREVVRREATEQQLRHAKEAAETANEAKSHFLARMSHEIRTPLNGVLGMTELLTDSALDSQQRHFLGIIDDSARSLLRIIDDLLDFTRVEAGKLVLEDGDFDLWAVVASVSELLAGRALARGVAIDYSVSEEVPRRMRGDSGRLRQILLNLVGNAIKFTPVGSVSLRVDVEPEESAEPCRLRISVTDTGIGIAAEDRERLFEPFVQGEESFRRRFGGTGLGLAISRELAELMGGRIEVESEVGRGSRFTLRLPLTPLDDVPPRSGSAGTREEAPASLRGSVLVVEDNPVNREVAVALLRTLGCSVEAVEEGTSAVALAAERRFQVILMDCEMPGMDGLEVTAAIRARERDESRERTPIVALSAHALPEDRERALAAGLDDYLVKPISRVQLHCTLARWLAVGGVD